MVCVRPARCMAKGGLNSLVDKIGLKPLERWSDEIGMQKNIMN